MPSFEIKPGNPEPPLPDPRASREPAQPPPPGDTTVHLMVSLPPGANLRLTLETLPGPPAEGAAAPRVEVVSAGAPVEVFGPAPAQAPAHETPAGRRAFWGSGVFRSWGPRLASGITRLRGRWKFSFEATLFLLALGVYLLIRLVGLQNFPIYFFTDEAVQTVLAADLARDGFRNPDGILLPTFFKNGYQYNLSLSVYAQLVPYLLFGKAVLVTRGVSVLLSLVGALAMGLILRDVFRQPYWWQATLLLSLVPGWFLHSRTAFETALATSLYAGFLYFYLRYRSGTPKHLYPALVFGALTFYAYSPAQLVMVVTGVALLFSDLRYHWEQRAVGFRGLVLLGVLALPYVRFRYAYPLAAAEHLRMLASYWIRPIPLPEKLVLYFHEYARGLSPAYWYFPHGNDLVRHQMKGYGHILLVTLPFAGWGLWVALRRFWEAGYRAVVLALLAAPAGGALVQSGVTRTLIFVIPATILTALGLSDAMRRLETRFRPRLRPQWLALGVFALLAFGNGYMAWDALHNGPRWFGDYGLGGMQYGARQVFGAVKTYLDRHPGAQMIVSPTWANGTDVVARFFFPDPLPIQMGSIAGHLDHRLPLTPNTVFVLTPVEYGEAVGSPKFTDIQVEQTLPYPNGQPGFYFVRLRYSDQAEALFAAEEAARHVLQEDTVTIDGEAVRVRYSPLDAGSIQQVFDGDEFTLGRTGEANPAVFELTFPQPRVFGGVEVIVGSIQARITVTLTPAEGSPVAYTLIARGSLEAPKVALDFDAPVTASRVRVEVENIDEKEPAHIHVWEIRMK